MNGLEQKRWSIEGMFAFASKASRDSMLNSLSGDLSENGDNPWNRCGLPPSLPSDSLSRRLLQGFFFAIAWLTMPVAVLTIHGWVGLVVHGIALSGAAGLLQRATIRTRMQLHRLKAMEGDRVCASVSERL